MFKTTLFVLLCAFCAGVASFDLGEQLARTFLIYKDLPLSTDSDSGWFNVSDTCDPNLGYAFTSSSGGVHTGNPIVLYFTAGGQIAGVGIVHFDAPLASMTDYWQPYNGSDSAYIMNVHFREPSKICSGDVYDELVGDQVVINQGSVNFNVPLTDSDAKAAKWTTGNCIGGMGTHWVYDLATAPVLSYNASQTLPLMPMYFEGNISAFLVHTATVQAIEPVGIWEGPFIPYLFCKNLCKGCDWSSSWTSTLHFLFKDHSELKCSSYC